ncbi:MAG: DEAD/DEAH box helicase [Acidimicrobiia bacterium]
MTVSTPTHPNEARPRRRRAAPTGGFAGVGVSAPVVDVLARQDIHEPFAIQSLVLADAIAGRDVLAKSRTGSGKTLAFAIPIVERLSRKGQPSALVLVPTRELANQVTEEFRTIAGARRLTVAAVYGGVSIAKQVKAAGRADIVVATPGRLLDLLRRRLLRLNGVGICVLDEADRMLDMGFLPDVRVILSVLPETRQTMLFSATLDGEVDRLATQFTRNPVRHEINDVRPVVSEAVHRFVAVGTGDKVATLAHELAGDRGATLVFVRTKRGADRLARNLAARDFGAQALHGDMSQNARERALRRFASGAVDVLVATDVAARGLDLDDISHVVNFDLPGDEKAYIHRVGRTARAGRSGTAVTFVTTEQQPEMARMAKLLHLEREFAGAGMATAHRRGSGPRSSRPRRRR